MDPTDAPASDRPADDVHLTAALARDLDAAFDAVVVAHQDRLYSIALRMLGDPRDAEEATQDALVRAYRALAGYGPERIRELRLRGWLATIVLNGCRTRLGRRATAGAAPLSLDDPVRPLAEPPASPIGSPAGVLERGAAAAAWGERLLRLPPTYRAPIVLRHVDGLSYPETAAALGRPEGTVKAQVHRGLGLLRAMLEAETHPGHEEMTA